MDELIKDTRWVAIRQQEAGDTTAALLLKHATHLNGDDT